jgi:hypothetical protein
MIGEADCGAIGGMKIGRGNRSTRRKPAPAPLCPPQIPLDQTPGSNPGRRDGKPFFYFTFSRIQSWAVIISICPFENFMELKQDVLLFGVLPRNGEASGIGSIYVYPLDRSSGDISSSLVQ